MFLLLSSFHPHETDLKLGTSNVSNQFHAISTVWQRGHPLRQQCLDGTSRLRGSAVLAGTLVPKVAILLDSSHPPRELKQPPKRRTRHTLTGKIFKLEIWR